MVLEVPLHSIFDPQDADHLYVQPKSRRSLLMLPCPIFQCRQPAGTNSSRGQEILQRLLVVQISLELGLRISVGDEARQIHLFGLAAGLRESLPPERWRVRRRKQQSSG